VISGNFAQSSGRAAKALEDPKISHSHNVPSYLQESNRGLSVDNNMMMYRTVFILSLKLLTLFLIVKLFGQTMVGGMGHGPMQMGWSAGAQGQGQGQGGYGSGGQQTQYPAVDVNNNPGTATSFVTATSTGAAAGASTGGAAGVQGLAAGVPHSGYLSPVASNQRPSFLYPTGPRFRFGLRYPPPRHMAYPPPHMMMAHPGGTVNNLGTQTQVIDTHSHMYVLPDGTHARIPGTSQTISAPVKSVETSSTSNSDTEAKSSASETAAASSQVETVVSTSSSSSSTSPQIAERRSSLAYREKLHQLQQAYEDWTLHANPGTRSF